jgi:hypothetical protein
MDKLTIKNFANHLQFLCYEASHAAGWWHDKDGKFLAYEPLMFSNKIALCHSELSEALEGDRTGERDKHLPHRLCSEVELADALIRIFDLAGAYGFDIGGAMAEKMEYNKKRLDHKKESREAEGGKKY